MPKAISYIRFSSGTQAKGSSSERQQDMVNEWLAENPEFTLITEQSQLDAGISGYKGDHIKEGAGLHKIITAIKKGLFRDEDVLLIEAFDRLGRLEETEMISLFIEIINSGISIITLEDNQTYNKSAIGSNKSLLYILVGKVQSAHEYSDRLSRRISKAWSSKRRKAKDGLPIIKANPFWLNSNGTLKDQESCLIREAIEMYLDGKGYRQIAIELNQDWNFKTLKRWFTSRALIGDWETINGEIIENTYEPLITKIKFVELQSAIRSREITQSKPSPYLLSGLLYCGECGGKLTIRRKEHKGEVILYTNCKKYLMNGSCSNNTTYDYSYLLHLFETTSSSYLLASAFEDVDETDLTDKIADIEIKIEDAEKALNRLADLLLNIPSNNQRFVDQYNETSEQLKQLQDSKKKLNESSNDQRWFRKIYQHLDEIKNNTQLYNQFLKRAEYRITCKGNVCETPSDFHEVFRYKIITYVNKPTEYLVEKHWYESELFGDRWTQQGFLAINRHGATSAKTFESLIRLIKSEHSAKRWIATVGKKRFSEYF